MAQSLSTNSKIVVFDSNVNLEDANTNNVKQGATVGDILALSSGGAAEVVTSHPVTDPTKVGEKVYYNGEEWIYASTALLQSIGMDSYASEGYPIPYNFSFRALRVVDNPYRFKLRGFGQPRSVPVMQPIEVMSLEPDGIVYDVEWDFSYTPNALSTGGGVGEPYDNVARINTFRHTDPTTGQGYCPINITKIWGAEYLYDIVDAGTGVAFQAYQSGNLTGTVTIPCSADVLNDFMTDLPSTTKTATLDLTGFSGGAAADASIATAKGYAVIQ